MQQMQTTNYENAFKSLTQYDKRFDGMFDQIKDKGYSCSYFGILTCLRFLQGYLPDVDTHEKNIIDAMTVTCLLNINAGMTFEDLILGCTNCDAKKIIATSVELIANNIIGPNEMFPKLVSNLERYAVMFLKNEKYFVVMVDCDGIYLRDCHVDTQHNFKTIDELMIYLSQHYQFTQMINIDGFQIDEYSSIEFLIFDQQFESDIITLLEPEATIHTAHTPAHTPAHTQIQYGTQTKQNVQTTNSPNNLLHGDMLKVPEKTLFSKNDIEYLQQLNIELSIDSNNMEKKTNVTNTETTKTTDLSEDEKIMLLELQKEIDELDNSQFVASLLMDSFSPDDMVDFK
jgi:hypothetical protein